MWLRWPCLCGANNACGLMRCPRCQALPPWITPDTAAAPAADPLPAPPPQEPSPRTPRRPTGAKSG